MRHTLFMSITLLFAFVLAFACASSSAVQKSERWVPYNGCTAAQCKSWNDECVAECINQHTMGTTECEAKCGANVSNCESSCPN